MLLTTSDGETLEADLSAPANPIGVAVIAHPHPQFGGDMNNPVVGALRQGFLDADFAALRFNFRGTGASTGTHGDGGAERLDLLSALTHAKTEYPRLIQVLAGYSFGADVALTIDVSGIAAAVLVAPPLRLFPVEHFGAADLERLILVPEHDQFSSPERTSELAAVWTRTTVNIIDMADHFLAGATMPVREETTTFARSLRTRAG